MAVAVVLAPGRLPCAAEASSSNNEDHRSGNTSKTRVGGCGEVGSYKLLKRIGQGGYGAVWKARHVESGELVAVKSSLHAGGEAAAALLREAAMLAACAGNPAVVQIREVVRVRVRVRGSESDDTHTHEHDDVAVHLVMEYVQGQSLHDVIRSRRRRGRGGNQPFTEPETRRAMARLLAGVSTMHARGVVHRDLKPGNVLVAAADDGGDLKICDLGLATSMAAAAQPSDDDTELTGTTGYMAPELLMGEKECGAPVDMWALGCIMAELVTGQPLFPAEDLCQQLIGIVDLLAIPDEVSLMPLGVSGASKLRERVPEELLSPAGFDVLQGLLEYNPKDRLTAVDALKMPWFAEAKDE